MDIYGDRYKLSPRVNLNGGYQDRWNIPQESNVRIIRNFRAHWFDFDKEAEIGIGVKWPTDIAQDECVISSQYHKEDPFINKGDTAVVAG